MNQSEEGQVIGMGKTKDEHRRWSANTGLADDTEQASDISVGCMPEQYINPYLGGSGTAASGWMQTPSAMADHAEMASPNALPGSNEVSAVGHKTKQLCTQDPEMMKFYEKYLTSKKLADSAMLSKRKLDEIDNSATGNSINNKRSKKLCPGT